MLSPTSSSWQSIQHKYSLIRKGYEVTVLERSGFVSHVKCFTILNFVPPLWLYS